MRYMEAEDLFGAVKKLCIDTNMTAWSIGNRLSVKESENPSNARMRVRRWIEDPPKSVRQWLAMVVLIYELSEGQEEFRRYLYSLVDNGGVTRYDEGEETETKTQDATTATKITATTTSDL